MDYIIFGMGAGATLVLVGWLFREFGPRIRDRPPADDEVLTGGELVTRMAWARFCGTCGMALLLCGLLLLVVTGITVLIAPEDGLGGLVGLATFGVCVILMLLWTGLYLRQFGTIGVIRPKPPKAEPAAPLAAPVQVATAGDGPGAEAPVAPSFEAAAAARGGFGRFGGLLRRRPAAPPEPEAIPTDRDVPPPIDAGQSAPAPPSAPPAAQPPDVSATEAVIDELAGTKVDGDDKRLALDDPLVTSVQTPAQQRAAATVDAPEPGESAGSGHPDDTLAERDGATGDDQQATDAAMDALRKRRIERLRKHSP